MEDLFEELSKFTLNASEISRFRRWHVEALLNQGADLVDRCLLELKDLRSLVYSKENLEISFTIDQLLDSTNIEKQKVQYRRNVNIEQHRVDSFVKTQDEFNKSLLDAEHSLGELEPEEHKLPLSRIIHEKRTENILRDLEKEISDNNLANAKDAESIFGQVVDEKKKSLLIRAKQIEEIKNQIAEAEKSLKRDYEDALVRSTVAQKGLREIYGFNLPLLPNKPKNPVSELSIWNREAIEFIVAYQQLDQAFTRIISLRNTLGEGQWNLLKTKPAVFRLNPDLFNQHENIRFRGIGASIIGKAGTIPWSVIITLPGKAIYQRGGGIVDVLQGDLPSCLIGKVENRSSFRAMEYGGTVSLVNASPIGKSIIEDGLWAIKLERPINESEIFSEIDDIILEINVVGQPI